MLEHYSSTPLYVQIKERLLNDIQSGRLMPGHKIPTEYELSAAYGVSRITVRGAVLELVKSGHLIRRQGKGTFVYKQTPGENALINQSFTSACNENGVIPGGKILAASVQIAAEEDINELKVPEGSKVFYLHRVRYANDSPVMLEYNFFPEKYSSLMHELSDNMSLYSLLESKFNIGKLKSVKKIGIVKTNAYQSELLDVKKGTPVLSLQEMICDINNVPVHRTRQYILGDRFEYIVKSL